MASRSAARRDQAATAASSNETEARLVALAEQLGWFLGTVRGKADGLLENEALRAEVGRVRDRATELLEQVNRGTKPAQDAVVSAAATAKTAVSRAATTARKTIGETAASVSASAQRVVGRGTVASKVAAKKAAKPAARQPAARKAANGKTPKASRGPVDAPGKKHRKPPPQVHIGRGMGEPIGKQMGQKSVKGDMRRGRQ